MKKNVMMRVAAMLLVCVLATTCSISGTFAKYVTTANASDNARVAKWGVQASVTGTAFAQKYELDTPANDNDGNPLVWAVDSDTKVVAPGTTGTFVGVNVTGIPEVAVNIENTATITISNFLVDGNFYCPIVVTINDTQYCGLDYATADAFAAALKGAIEAANGNYAANTNLSLVAGLNGDYTWQWAFDTAAHNALDCTHDGAQTDVKDTALGNYILNNPATEHTISITVETTITQID